MHGTLHMNIEINQINFAFIFFISTFKNKTYWLLLLNLLNFDEGPFTIGAKLLWKDIRGGYFDSKKEK